MINKINILKLALNIYLFFFEYGLFIPILILTFDLFFGITHSFPGADNEKGIRFNAGAVPAAVCLIKNFLIYMPLFVVRLMGRQSKGRRARIPAEIH